jgi:sterol 3beta-glucosyltransferase
MKVALVGYGTRGDVQPFVCIGAALLERGHEVVLLAPRNGTSLGEAAGLTTVELPLDVQELFAEPQAQRMLAAGRINAFFRWLHQQEKAFQLDLRKALLDGTSGADAIVCHPLLEDRCVAIGEARGVPALATHFFPVLPSRAFPSPFVSLRSLGPLNMATHRLMLRMLWRLSRGLPIRLRSLGGRGRR